MEAQLKADACLRVQPSLRDGIAGQPIPGVETPGYYHAVPPGQAKLPGLRIDFAGRAALVCGRHSTITVSEKISRG
jgi:hypothetical protein